VELVFKKAKRNQSIHIKQISHGKSDRISITWPLVSRGAPGPALKTGRPVKASRTMADLTAREWRGTSTILSPSMVASSSSPGWSPSFRRIGPGRTICPLLDSLACIVRKSYHAGRFCIGIRFCTTCSGVDNNSDKAKAHLAPGERWWAWFSPLRFRKFPRLTSARPPHTYVEKARVYVRLGR
jgi:hypothetical protein